MRSWHELIVIAALVAACGNDVGIPEGGDDAPPIDPDACETSFLDYNNFGAPFVVNWCRGCHSSAVPAGMRQDAPADVNFDDAADLVEWRERIRTRATGTKPTMPPAGGPTETERELLAEWLDCGMK
ncbi:MAG: hypothetical protein H0T89_09845 [Deltaproteobacteria bacterium]|nr:hypothetical protein [Deltaproteobacteria bacterium]